MAKEKLMQIKNQQIFIPWFLWYINKNTYGKVVNEYLDALDDAFNLKTLLGLQHLIVLTSCTESKRCLNDLLDV